MIRLSALTAATTWVTLWTWRGFTTDPLGFLGPLAILAAVLVAVGAAGRRSGLSRWATLGLQSLVVLCFCTFEVAGSLIPTPAALLGVRDGLTAAVDSAQRYAAPVAADVPSIHPLLLVGGGACLLLAELAVTVGRTPLAGLVLLSIYTVPVSLLPKVGWQVFCIAALGYCLMLLVHEGQGHARWGPQVRAERTQAARAGAATSGVIATSVGLAVLAPALVPTFDLDLVGFGRGAGGGDTVTLANPIVDLRRDLHRGTDRRLLRVRTDEPDPAYLRTSVLTRFNGNTWSPGDREVPSSQTARGPLPPLSGVPPRVPRTEYQWGITVHRDFRSTWLPVPSPISRINAAGDWRYDLDTMDFMAHEEGLDTQGAQYSATAVRLDLDAVAMASAPSGRGAIGPRGTELPENLPDLLTDLAEEVTAGRDSDFEKGVALQNWFRDGGGFTYSLDTSTGNGNDDLVEFLQDRVGYCEQFSAAMAVMARSLDIPARVAIGFLRPEPIGENVYEFSSHDLHAWPELYISGAGWVAFEPTPAARASSVPGYTTQRIPEPRRPDGPSASASAAEPTADPSAAPQLPEETPTAADGETSSTARWTLAALAALAAVLGVLAVVPRWIRRTRRRARWEAGSVSAAWAELRDSALDHGIAWPVGLSPRATAARLAESFAAPSDYDDPIRPERGPRTNPGAVRALDRLVVLRERELYSPHAARVDAWALREDVERCVDGLRAGTDRRTRRRARWWPASAWRRLRADEPASRVDDLTEHLTQ